MWSQGEYGKWARSLVVDTPFICKIKKIKYDVLYLLDVWFSLVDHHLANGTILFDTKMLHDAAMANCNVKETMKINIPHIESNILFSITFNL